MASLPPFSLSQAANLRLSQKTVDQRAPDSNDDINAGYIVGDYWQFGGKLWQCLRNTAGAAAWQTIYNIATPVVDAVGASVLAAYGMKKLVNAYSGPCINVVRASDSTALDVGFLADGWIDAATLFAFLANTTGKIATWYDQSGAANDATQPTAANRPTIGFKFVNGRPAISVDQTGGANQYLVLPSGVAITRNNFSVACIGAPGVDGMLAWDLSADGTIVSINYPGGGGSTTFIKEAGTYPNAMAQSSGISCLAGLVSALTGYTSFTGTDQITGTAFSNAAVTPGGLIGASYLGGEGAYINSALWQAFIVWGSALTTAQLTALQQAAFCNFDLKPQFRERLLLAGDSISFGYQAQVDNLPLKLNPLLARPMNIVNQGVQGATTTSYAAYSAWLAQNYRATATNIAVVWLGTNDLAAPGVPATVWANLQTYCGIVRAAGYKIVLVTMLPRNISGSDALRTTFNGLIRAGWAGVADALADVGADPTAGPYSAISNTALYPDNLHPSGLGYDYIAPTIAEAINSILLQSVA